LHPRWQTANARQFFTEVSRLLADGVIEDGRSRLLKAADDLAPRDAGAVTEVDHPGSAAALAETVRRYGRSVDAMRPLTGGVAQPFTERLVDVLSDVDGPQVVVVHGRAGSGKSTVALDAIRQIIAEGWSAAVLRMDALEAVVRTAADLGTACGLVGSPAVLLAGVADGGPAVLLVDQLDAVSTYSGRMSDSFEAVDDILDQTRSTLNVKIVLAIRSVDLETDPRMRRLLADRTRVGAVELGDLDPVEVRVSLVRAGVEVTGLSPSMLEMLRVPLHLAVFSRLAPSSQASSYATLSHLYVQFTREVRRAIEETVGTLEWTTVCGALTEWMSRRESLVAPVAVLDAVPDRQVAALESAGVLVRDGNRIGFFHETYFDFAFAQGFVASSRQNLHDFLADGGQALFRRAQTRQVLEHLADTDRAAFLDIVTQLLTSEKIRSHLLDVVVAVLRQLDATPAEWLALEPLAFGEGRRAGQLAGLLSTPAWFDAADTAGRWERLLAESATEDRAARQLIGAARDRSARVAELMRPYLGVSDIWTARLRTVVAWTLGSAQPGTMAGIVDLAIELTDRGDLDGLRAPIAVNSDFWSLLYGPAENAPAETARLAGAWLRRALARAQAEGSHDPFASEHLSTHSQSGPGVIRRLADAAPTTFLEETVPVLTHIADYTATAAVAGNLRRSRWGWVLSSDRVGVDGALATAVEDALRRLADDEPAVVARYAQELADTDVVDLRVLACRGWAAVPASSDEAVDWLLSDDRNLDLEGATLELVSAVTRRCDEDRLAALVRRLIDFYPAWETKPDRLRGRGYTQYTLLNAVEPSRRSPEADRRIAELARKFPDLSPVPPPSSWTGTVQPPIPRDRAVYLSDEDWARAVRKYREETENWAVLPPVGGASQLAQLLGERAAVDPERFARLALSFDAEVVPVYLGAVITSTTGKLPVELLTQLCLHAYAVAGLRLGDAICRAIGKTAVDSPPLLDLVENILNATDPGNQDTTTSADSAGQPDPDPLPDHRSRAREAAALVIAQVLVSEPGHADRLLPVVGRLATDPSPAVRNWAAVATLCLLAEHEDTALQLAEKIFDRTEADLADADYTGRLLTEALLRQPERFAGHLQRALTGPDPVVERAGAIWAAVRLHGTLPDALAQQLTELTPEARRGAAAQLATEPGLAVDQLTALFGDSDPQVRQAASTTFEKLDTMPPAVAQRLVEAFTASVAFPDNLDELFHRLERSSQLLPEATLDACQRAVEVAGIDLGDFRTSGAAVAHTVTTLVLRLYRQGPRPLRERCLDLIDRLSDAGALGLQEALVHER
jgi:hypothetical protein